MAKTAANRQARSLRHVLCLAAVAGMLATGPVRASDPEWNPEPMPSEACAAAKIDCDLQHQVQVMLHYGNPLPLPYAVTSITPLEIGVNIETPIAIYRQRTNAKGDALGATWLRHGPWEDTLHRDIAAAFEKAEAERLNDALEIYAAQHDKHNPTAAQ